MTHPTQTDQAELTATRTLGRADHDPRTGDQFKRDLQAETDASLRADPTRWPWVRGTGTAYAGRERRRREGEQA